MQTRRLFAIFILLFPLKTFGDGRAFDSVTGEDTRQYSTNPSVNFDHLSLTIDMSDLMSRSFTATETLTFRTAGEPIAFLKLDAVGLHIDRVTDLAGKPLEFRQDDEHVTVHFSAELPPDHADGITFSYTCSHPKTGMIFTLPDNAYPDRPISIHTQGEAEMNRNWFIAHDEPNAKIVSEITVTIPEKLQALSNGALISRDTPAAGKVRYHYAMSHPQASYLVSLVVGEFVVTRDSWRGKPVEYWLPPTMADDAARTFGKTPRMIELFSTLTGVEFPWEKYAQAVVYNFAAGGMENTTCTTLTENAPLDARAALDADSESLIAHELAHEWFGNLLTCKSWMHLWLNEGFAVFMDDVWEEHEHGEARYQHEIFSTMRGVASGDDPLARGGVVWPYYKHPDDTFSRPVSNPYSKGSSVLHMLRISLGEDVFWKCIGEYLRGHLYQNVETDDLRKTIDAVSGRSYGRFFEQWIYRPGSPKVRAKYEWNDEKQTAKVSFEQTQKIEATAPAFWLDIPVWFVAEDGTLGKSSAHLDGRFGSVEMHFDHEPVEIDVDPQCAVLADWEIEQPTSRLLHAVKSGVTPIARFRAIAAVADRDEEPVRQALIGVLADESVDRAFRTDAAAALGKMQQPTARDALVAAFPAIKDHRVRRATVDAIAMYRSDAVALLLQKLAADDPAVTVQQAAISGLANELATDETFSVLMADTTKMAARDAIRTIAVRTLATLGDERGIAPAMALAAAGQPYRSRPQAADALGRLGAVLPPEKKKPIREFLVALLDDPMENVQYSAARALGDLGDEKAITPLRRFASGSGPETARDVARSAIESIQNHAGEPQSIGDLRERIDTLEKSRERMEKQFNSGESSSDRAGDHLGERKGSPTTRPTTAATTQ